MITLCGATWVCSPISTPYNGTAAIALPHSTVRGDRWDSLPGATRGKTVRVERTPGVLSLFAEGGDAIFAVGTRCSLGFNVPRRRRRTRETIPARTGPTGQRDQARSTAPR